MGPVLLWQRDAKSCGGVIGAAWYSKEKKKASSLFSQVHPACFTVRTAGPVSSPVLPRGPLPSTGACFVPDLYTRGETRSIRRERPAWWRERWKGGFQTLGGGPCEERGDRVRYLFRKSGHWLERRRSCHLVILFMLAKFPRRDGSLLFSGTILVSSRIFPKYVLRRTI